MKRVDFAGLAFEAMSGSPLIVLREQDDPHRILPIFVAGPDAAAIALAASGQVPSRPLTHDLMATLVRRLDGHLDAVEVTELRDGAFIASMSIHGPLGDDRVDTRPSDAIALAVRLGAPLFVAEAVLDEAGTVPVDEPAVPDPVTIDVAVDEFRAFLADVDPSQFEFDDGTDHDRPEDPDDPGG